MGETMFQSHIYLEVRIKLPSSHKAFCNCPIGISEETVSCPVCSQKPGSNPFLNITEAAPFWKLASALDAKILKTSNYEKIHSSPVLSEKCPLSLLSLKIAENGYVDIEFHRRKKRIHIESIRIEEDSGRLTHSGNKTRIEYQYAGAPSIRLTTAPDFELGEEAELFLEELLLRIQYLELIQDVTIKSVIRCNAYVALATYPQKPTYYIKLRNLNSFNFVRKAINSELNRQETLLLTEQKLESESRIWNETQNRTEFFQKRSESESPHFLKEDNFPSFIYDCNILLDKNFVELPKARQERLVKEYGLNSTLASFLCDEKSRVDFFEQAVSFGANPKDAATWLNSDIIPFLRRKNLQLSNSPLTPKRFSWIIQQFSKKVIYAPFVKALFQEVLLKNEEPSKIMLNQKKKIPSNEQILLYIDEIAASHSQEVLLAQEGEKKPLEYLTGQIIKKTQGLASPLLVKNLIKQRLNISVVYVLSMGGAITGEISEDESIAPGTTEVLKTLLKEETLPSKIQYIDVLPYKRLSEELVPSDWAYLISEILSCLSSGTAKGIVITHGSDTLTYTAALIYWLFAGSQVPIVFTAATKSYIKNKEPQQNFLESFSKERKQNLISAINAATNNNPGVYVTFKDKTLSPLNLKFRQPIPEGYSNWNMPRLIFSGTGLIDTDTDLDTIATADLLDDAAKHFSVSRLFPGLRIEKLSSLLTEDISFFFLELYDSGTGSMQEGPYSLKEFLHRANKSNCRIYCTSQQEMTLDFTGYTTAKRMWREGPIPLGNLTIETATALYFAASLVADSTEETASIIEEKALEI